MNSLSWRSYFWALALVAVVGTAYHTIKFHSQEWKGEVVKATTFGEREKVAIDFAGKLVKRQILEAYRKHRSQTSPSKVDMWRSPSTSMSSADFSFPVYQPIAESNKLSWEDAEVKLSQGESLYLIGERDVFQAYIADVVSINDNELVLSRSERNSSLGEHFYNQEATITRKPMAETSWGIYGAQQMWYLQSQHLSVPAIMTSNEAIISNGNITLKMFIVDKVTLSQIK